MAPTEILAEQHFRGISSLLAERTRFRVGYLTSAVKGSDRKSLMQDLKAGKIDLLIGTHALIEKPVDFARLGMIVVDEQHRFGVLQRSRLMQKGSHPDVLVMTATPIPRSLALTLYGDLDLSVLDEMPPGRRPVQTVLAGEKKRAEIYRGLRRQVRQGRQAYIVYPLVEESEKLDLKAAVEMAAHLQEDVFPDLHIGLLHGRLKSDEKEAVMKAFARGQSDILVSTTVIEVGVDVSNASIMVVEHAERFGLSQLHQLRGRIGRGPHESYCVLMMGPRVGDEARQRLEIMRRSNDGFKIAEKDLELRGPGEFIGTRQSGLPEFSFANLARDRKWIERSHQDARQFIQEELKQEGGDRKRLLNRLKGIFKDRLPLARVG
ncbi:MAG TPA: ATP-dependent DNA helicase RecG, partial [Acidobacteriota bacterium]|nr:ATP-dependent DNA helicase RecG [Acidobacteriota bacterium]